MNAQHAAPPPFLTAEEINGICQPLTMPAAQCKYLAGLGLLVKRKPNGHALVARSEFERVMGAERFGRAQNDAHNGPNVTGMLEHLNRRKHGQKTQGR